MLTVLLSRIFLVSMPLFYFSKCFLHIHTDKSQGDISIFLVSFTVKVLIEDIS